MLLVFIALTVGICSAARLDNAYLPPRGQFGTKTGSFGQNSASFGQNGASFGQKNAAFGQNSATFGQNSASFGQNGAQFGHSGASYAQNSGFSHSGGAGNFGPSSNLGYNAIAQPSSAFGGQYSGGYGGQASGAYGGQSSPQDAGAQILKSNSEVNADSFSYEYETSNGIRADASGVATNGVQSQGSFSYKGDDGQDYSITYTADENGYRPQGAHLPTPPPIPEAILRSLEQNAKDEAAGIVDDGSYHGEGGSQGGYSSQGHSGQGFSAQGQTSQGYSGQGYSGQSYSGQGYSGQGFSGQGFSGQSYSGQGFSGQGYTGQGSGNGLSNQYLAPSRTLTSPNNSGVASRQYLAPSSGNRGNGNFNPRSGYQY